MDLQDLNILNEIFDRHLADSRLSRRQISPQPPAFGRATFIRNESLQFNAQVALDRRGTARYTFNQGVACSLADAAMTLACTPEFLPEVPVAPKEIIRIFEPDPKTRFINYQVQENRSPLFSIYTTNEVRQSICDMIFGMAVRFLSLHEQGHYLRGHLHYLGSNAKEFNWSEISAEGVLPPITAQALELHADGIAAHLLLNTTGWNSTMPGPLRRAELNWILYTMVGIVTVYCILQRAEVYATPSVLEGSHPPARIRIFVVLELLHMRLAAVIPDQEEALAFNAKLFPCLALVMQQLGSDPIQTAAFNEYFDPEKTSFSHPDVLRYLAISKQMAEMIEILEPYRRQVMKQT